MIRCDRVIVERSGRMVIDRLSLSVGAGETLAVIGRSGAGKTTLLEAIATAVPVRGGDVVIDGHSVRRDPDAVRARIGSVPSHLTAWPNVRADVFLALFGRSAGLAGHGLEAAVDRALDLAGLGAAGETPIDCLPDGQAKLLLVGRALLHAPDVLVLDDPFGNLDPDQRLALEQLISDMQIGGRCVVAAIDDGHVPDCFTHLAVLAEGRVVEHGPATLAAFAGGRSWRYRLRCPGQAEAAASVVGRLVDRVEASDADTLDCTLSAGRQSSGPAIAAVIETLVHAGISLEDVRLHPAWTCQLLDATA
ncbi:MAG: ATP-binding cassette domain-containing protein [Planctomycetia bacterium]